MRKTILTFIVAAMGTCMSHSEDYEHVSASYECSFLKPTKEFKSHSTVSFFNKILSRNVTELLG